MSILDAIETRNGVRGTLTDPYGVYADPSIADFIAGVPVRRDDSHRPLDCGTLNRTGRVSP